MKPVSRKENINKPFTPYLLDLSFWYCYFSFAFLENTLVDITLSSLELLCLSLSLLLGKSPLCVAVGTVVVRVPEQ